MKINVKSVIEAALFVSGKEGISQEKLEKISRLKKEDFEIMMEEMIVDYAKNPVRGIVIKKINNAYKFLTKPEIGKVVSSYFGISARQILTNPMIEILTIIAYSEPCTKSKILELRKNDPTTNLDKLIELGFVEEVGRSESVGKPYLYAVTKKFYDVLGINSIKELPEITLPDETIKSAEEELAGEESKQEEEKPAVNFFDTNREDN